MYIIPGQTFNKKYRTRSNLCKNNYVSDCCMSIRIY